MIVVSDKLSTESFHAFIDEQLTEEQYVQVEAQLDEIPEKIEEIQQCQIINERLREVFDPVVEEPVPDDLFELALYGVTSETEDDPDSSQYLDSDQFGYDYEENIPDTMSGYEDHIESPLDSLDTALDLQDEGFIDEDNEFADLEALSDDSMAEFDIDAISDNESNIIPDIFDQDEGKNNANNVRSNPAGAGMPDDTQMLDSIDSLSLEPSEEDDQSSEEQASTTLETVESTQTPEHAQEQQRPLPVEPPELELESLEEEPVAESQHSAVADDSGSEQDQPQPGEPAAQVLEALESSEQLALEPLDDEAGAADIESPATTDATEPQTIFVGQDGAAQAESSPNKPRKVLGNKQPETPSPEESPVISEADVAPAETPVQQAMESLLEESSQSAGVSENPSPTSYIPEDPQQQDTSSGESVEPSTLTADEFPIDEITDELDEISDPHSEMPQDVVAEFFAEKKANPDFELSEVVKQFEEVSEEVDPQSTTYMDQQLFDSPVAHIKDKANDVLHSINSKFAQFKSTFVKKTSDSTPDFNKLPPLDEYRAAPTPTQQEQPDIQHAFDEAAVDYDLQQPTQPPSEKTSNELVPVAKNETNEFDFDVGVDEETRQPGALSNKIGDTLRYYKQKLAQGQIGNDVSDGEGQAPLDRYKHALSQQFAKLSEENRGSVGGVILLCIGLLVGGAVMSLSEPPVTSINNEKVEQLAIDAHILYTQQDQNFAGNPTTGITESMQWLSARIGKPIRLADVKLEGFEHQRAIVMPTMVNYATANIFENSAKEKMTLFIAASVDGITESPLMCRIPTAVDGMCSWVKDSVHYVVVANLSLTRVRAFSQNLVEQL